MASAKPVILAVDDDVPVLRAVERDLRGRYGNDYRVVAATAAEEALEAVRQLSLRGSTVALFVVDQRMPRMTGIEFLSQALELQPDAKRVLLTAYADTDVAIRAINDIRLDHYILKPWDPPEEKLFPITDDLLSDWSATFRPSVEGLRLLSGRWAPGGHNIRDYLTRNQVPYLWLDPTEEGEGQRLAATLASEEPIDPAVPVVLFPDGSSLRNPTHMQIAEKVGLQTRAALPFYDLLIVGGGPAGLAAAVYGASEGLKTLLIEREAPGRTGGDHQPHRELSRLPGRPLRRRPRAARAGPGASPRGRDPLAPGGDRRSPRGPVPGREPGRTGARSPARRCWWRPGSATASSSCLRRTGSPARGSTTGRRPPRRSSIATPR